LKNPIFGRTKLFWTTITVQKNNLTKGGKHKGLPLLPRIYEIRFKGAYLRVCPCEIIDLKLYGTTYGDKRWAKSVLKDFLKRRHLPYIMLVTN